MTMLKRILLMAGPGFVTASVVLGPGSVTVASKTGALFGYSLLWWLALLWAFMLTYTAMAAKIGVMTNVSLLRLVSERLPFGRWVAAALGFCVFFICASFQTGDVIGVSTSLSTVTGIHDIYFQVAFPAVCILIFFFSPNIYKVIERLMSVMVITMIVTFLFNVFLAKPSPAALLNGLVPRFPPGSGGLMTAMAATNFVVAAAFYQAYLVKEKAWTKENFRDSFVDSAAGITILFVLVGVITITSAAVLKPAGITVKNAGEMAVQLEPLLGPAAKFMFCGGLFAASFSSLAVNALVGGTLLADGLGLPCTAQSPWVRVFATVIMLLGLVMALWIGDTPVASIVLVQRLTLLATPLLAVALCWAANDRRVVGDAKNGLGANVLAAGGFAVILVLTAGVIRSLCP